VPTSRPTAQPTPKPTPAPTASPTPAPTAAPAVTITITERSRRCYREPSSSSTDTSGDGSSSSLSDETKAICLELFTITLANTKGFTLQSGLRVDIVVSANGITQVKTLPSLGSADTTINEAGQPDSTAAATWNVGGPLAPFGSAAITIGVRFAGTAAVSSDSTSSSSLDSSHDASSASSLDLTPAVGAVSFVASLDQSLIVPTVPDQSVVVTTFP